MINHYISSIGRLGEILGITDPGIDLVNQLNEIATIYNKGLQSTFGPGNGIELMSLDEAGLNTFIQDFLSMNLDKDNKPIIRIHFTMDDGEILNSIQSINEFTL